MFILGAMLRNKVLLKLGTGVRVPERRHDGDIVIVSVPFKGSELCVIQHSFAFEHTKKKTFALILIDLGNKRAKRKSRRSALWVPARAATPSACPPQRNFR
ncbi:hypothetical protein OUZ56_002455 [Daphnia magna]|uniref:Uncharacterized protein n=1 Tax=Daphnia magna TaxID=35525 RepID=A0ABR0A664_9CRUS|nr:hypothetical protein OUZ56_002455 [Daphnia magna]